MCSAGYYSDRSNFCFKCTGGDVFVVISVVIFSACGLGLLAMFAASDLAMQSSNRLTLISDAGQWGVALQLMSFVTSSSAQSIQWVEPVQSILTIGAVAFMNLDVLRLACWLNSDSAIAKYLLALFVLPVAISALTLITFILVKITSFFPTHALVLDRFDFFNSIGLLTAILFMPVASLCVTPFSCVKGPNNGVATVATVPSWVCGSDPQQAAASAFGALGILFYLASFLALVATLIRFYPRMIMSRDATNYVKATKFLFVRFSRQCFYYGGIYLTRSVLVAMCSVVFPSAFVRSFSMFAVLHLSVYIQCFLLPWRTDQANVMDAILGHLLLIIMIAILALLDIQLVDFTSQVTASILTSTILIFLCVWASFAAAIWLALKGHIAKKFGVYLSYHKRGAASRARLVKQLLEKKVPSEIFLDCDYSETLESLFDIIRSETASLCLILTSSTLKRPWCAGELMVAHVRKVPIYILTSPDYNALSDEAMEDFDSHWTSCEMAPLFSLGVTMEKIKQAYQHLRTLHPNNMPLTMHSFKDLLTIDHAVERLCRQIKLPKRRSEPPAITSLGSGQLLKDMRIYILSNTQDAEAMACAFVLGHLLTRNQAKVKTFVVFSEHDFKSGGAIVGTAILTLLTASCLTSPGFAQILFSASNFAVRCSSRGRICDKLLVLDKDFSYPTEKQLATEVVPQVSSRAGLDAMTLSKCYNDLLQNYALPFSNHASCLVQASEVETICKQIAGNNDVAVEEQRRQTVAEAVAIGKAADSPADESKESQHEKHAKGGPEKKGATHGEAHSPHGVQKKARGQL